jgi:hypothetical protein
LSISTALLQQAKPLLLETAISEGGDDCAKAGTAADASEV